METIWHWGADWIIALQQGHTWVGVYFWNAVTCCGSAYFYLFCLPLIYWTVDKRTGIRLSWMLLLSAYLNIVIKYTLAHPRPYNFDPRVADLEKFRSHTVYGLPSGHTQQSTVLWGVLALQLRRWWAWTTALVMVGLISYSRIYLGVHFPTDVLGGLLMGLLVLTMGTYLQKRLGPYCQTRPLTRQLILALSLPVLLIVLAPNSHALLFSSSLAGLLGGLVLEQQLIHFNSRGSVWQRLLRLPPGLMVLGTLYLIYRALPDSLAGVKVFWGLLIGSWISWGAPWLFRKLGLAANPAQEA